MPRFFAEINDSLGRRVPNSYAGLRELDRFMRTHKVNTPYKIIGGDGREIVIDNTLFDLCFLVDVEDYNGQQPGIRSDLGALPAIVDMIVAHTDLRLGLRLNAANVNVTSNYQLYAPAINNSGNYEYQASRDYLAQMMGHDSLDTTLLYIRGTRKDLQLEVEKIAWT